jgi:hypothetical protein
MGNSAFELQQKEIKLAQEELAALEVRAGIASEMEKVQEGCFLPYGIDGEGDHLPQEQQLENCKRSIDCVLPLMR